MSFELKAGPKLYAKAQCYFCRGCSLGTTWTSRAALCSVCGRWLWTPFDCGVDSDGDGDGRSRRSARVRQVARRSQWGEGQVHVLSASQRRRLYARLQCRSQVKPKDSFPPNAAHHATQERTLASWLLRYLRQLRLLPTFLRSLRACVLLSHWVECRTAHNRRRCNGRPCFLTSLMHVVSQSWTVGPRS